MSTGKLTRRLALWLLLSGSLLCAWSATLQAQFVQRQVGGVSIDADGVLKNLTVDQLLAVRREQELALRDVPGDMVGHTEMRKISLRQLEAAIVEHRKQGRPLPDEIRYLAGLQRIRYVFVVPDQQDIVLAGPAEGWRVDNLGEVVGIKTGQPVLLLDDLLVALRTVDNARQGGISCSIDPTTDGLQRVRALASQLQTIGIPDETAANLEQTLGPQIISVTGVPASSHYARVMVAADYKMKRLAMGFDHTPIKAMPSFLSMIKAGPRGMNNMMPRWWLAPNYEGVLASPDGMAYELKGAGVKCVAEEDFLKADGSKQRGAKPNPVSKKWADSMTAHYDELAAKESIFGELRNCIDLAVVAALMTKEHLTEKAGHSFPELLNAKDLPIEQYHAPKHVNSIASLMQKGSNWVITVSGGVQIDSWTQVMKPQPSEKLASVRAAETTTVGKSWWWN
jgi:hypothetical protein